jgi:hypothetical protein
LVVSAKKQVIGRNPAVKNNFVIEKKFMMNSMMAATMVREKGSVE